MAASELDRAEAIWRELQARLERARVLLDYATVRAPFDGTVVRTFKEAGEAVVVGSIPDPLFRLADLSQLKVRAETPERDIAAIRVGQPGEVVADAYPQIRPLADARDGSLRHAPFRTLLPRHRLGAARRLPAGR